MDAKRHEYVGSLTKTSIFRGLSGETLARLSDGTTASVFGRGSVVFACGAAATGIHVVTSGQLKLCLETSEGVEHVVELIKEGDTLGEAASLTNRSHLVTATAMTTCRLLHIDRCTLNAELERDPALARRIIAALSDRLYQQTSALENVLFRKATGRVARFILDRLTADGARTSRRVALSVRKGLIASHLNMTQEHFSRTLRELTIAGLIKVDGVNVDVIQVDKLRDTAGLIRAPQYLAAAE
jgi:CRP/FNR family transcriptional regulator, dissimilatory nitrate respiration regulator